MSSHPLSAQQGHLEPAAGKHAPELLTVSKDLNGLSGQPDPLLGHGDSGEVFAAIQAESAAFQLVPVAPGHHERAQLCALCTLPLVFVTCAGSSPARFTG